MRTDSTSIEVPTLLKGKVAEVIAHLESGGRVIMPPTLPTKSIILPEGVLSVQNGVIGFQVDCQGAMSSDLAKAIVLKYPIVFRRYQEFLAELEHPSEQLGTVLPVKANERLTVLNLFGLKCVPSDETKADYEALKIISDKLKQKTSSNKDLVIHLPWRMGIHLEVGAWEEIKIFLDPSELSGLKHQAINKILSLTR